MLGRVRGAHPGAPGRIGPGGAAQGPPRRAEKQVGRVFRPGNRLSLAENGAVFDAIAGAIRRAKVSVNIVTFIWRPSGPSDRVLGPKLWSARRREMPVLVDTVGSPTPTPGSGRSWSRPAAPCSPTGRTRTT